jgi:hypothetical protein
MTRCVTPPHLAPRSGRIRKRPEKAPLGHAALYNAHRDGFACGPVRGTRRTVDRAAAGILRIASVTASVTATAIAGERRETSPSAPTATPP